MEANTLVYTRDQLVSILEGFIALLNAPALKEELSALAPDEAKINQAIEARQAAIFQSHGINPERGFADMRRIRMVHGNDPSIIQKMVFIATREEVLVNEALGMKVSDSTPKNVEQFTQAMSNLPAALQQMQQRLAENPQMLEQLSPEQQQQIQQLMMMQQQVRMMQMMGNMGGAMNAPGVNNDAAVLNALLTNTNPQGGGNAVDDPQMPGLMPNMPSGLPTGNPSNQSAKKEQKDD